MLFLRYCSAVVILMMVLSVIPKDIFACYQLPIVDPETYAQAEKDLDKAREALEKAQTAYDNAHTEYHNLKLHPYILNVLDSLKYKGTSMNSEQASDRAVHEATQGGRDLKNAYDNSQRKQKLNQAETALNAAKAAYDEALKLFNSYQPETRHIKLGMACGNPDHSVIACEFNDPLLWPQVYRSLHMLNHNRIQASCSANKMINGTRVYCSVTGFYFCQNHEHVYPGPSGSGSGS